MDKKIEQIDIMLRQFCEKTPLVGQETQYLSVAGELYEKYCEARYLYDHNESPEKIEKLYQEILSMI